MDFPIWNDLLNERDSKFEKNADVEATQHNCVIYEHLYISFYHIRCHLAFNIIASWPVLSRLCILLPSYASFHLFVA